MELVLTTAGAATAAATTTTTTAAAALSIVATASANAAALSLSKSAKHKLLSWTLPLNYIKNPTNVYVRTFNCLHITVPFSPPKLFLFKEHLADIGITW